MHPLLSCLPPGKRIVAVCALLFSFAAFGAESPRERLLLDFNWRFHLGDAVGAGQELDYPEVSDLAKTRVDEVGQGAKLIADLPDPATTNLGANVSFAKPDFDDRSWRRLDLPHDWVVELPFATNANVGHGFKPVGKGFPENNIGWYRRAFGLPASDAGKALWIEFDGVYRSSLVWFNGHCLGRNSSGYGGFRYDISKVAHCGGTNELVVRVDASRFEGWFYEGAGIYRHVWLVKTSPLHFAPDGVFVHTRFTNNVPGDVAQIEVGTRIVKSQDEIASIVWKIFAPNGEQVGMAKKTATPDPDHDWELEPTLFVNSPVLWSPESPKLYTLVAEIRRWAKFSELPPEAQAHVKNLYKGMPGDIPKQKFESTNIADRIKIQFGIRTIAFDAEKGFLLNGKPYVIKGTCNHQDHAGVGTAMPDTLQYFRIRKLKEMGSNAIRTSHNPPTPELLDACDELGMLVMDENRRVDNTPQALHDLIRLVLRDRNHPSVFIWSLGNEEGYLQGTRTNENVTPADAQEMAIRVITPMQNLAHDLDPTRLCTIAMNGGWGEGFSKVIDVQGFNYRTKNIDDFRAKFPTQRTVGTETASTRTTRGIYADDKERGYVAAYGENGIEKAWAWWPYFAKHAFTSGGFVWTGFDYRGEPTPYKWPCISSHFGLMDTCGFPKDIYYYYQAWWTDKPVLHLATHWSLVGGEGKTNLVRCFSNCKSVELFLNGKSFGKQTMSTNGYLDWNVAYEPGVLSAKGYNGMKFVAETKVETIGVPVAVQLQPDRSTITADGEDASIIDVSVVDDRGRVVANAGNLIRFELKGPGKIIGVGNGDPSSHEPDKASERRAFNGFAQVIVQATRERGTIELTAASPILDSAKMKIKTEAAKELQAVLP